MHGLADSHLVAGTIAVVGGVIVAVQSRINGELADRIGDSFVAALVSFGGGLICGLLLLCVSPWGRAGLGKLRASLRAGRHGNGGGINGSLAWWQLAGGLGGAFYILAQGVTVTALGVALFTVCIVAGQTGNSLLVDRLGLGPGGIRYVTRVRVIAALISVVAVLVGVSNRLDVDEFKIGFVLLVVVAGCGAAFQQAFNGQVARVSESAVVSSLVNFVVGFGALLVATAAVHVVTGDGMPSMPPIFSDSWWLYASGPMGAAYTIGMALAVRTLGVLVFGLATIAGQLTGALLLDVALPTAGTTVGWQLITAVALTFVAVALAGVSGSRTASATASAAAAR
jgi:bacterial/archaeal transporter family-2 protein